jgi:hypothetical protein
VNAFFYEELQVRLKGDMGKLNVPEGRPVPLQWTAVPVGEVSVWDRSTISGCVSAGIKLLIRKQK